MNQSFEIPSVEVMSELLPAYRFVSLVASGDDEAVYVASQKSLDRHVAVKVYAPYLSGNGAFTEAFQSMARQMARLNHANLIGVFNSGTVQGMHYLVMEFVPGRSIWQAFDGVAQEPGKVAGLIGAICDGLGHAHENGILHGGLSVSNILINQKGEPKVGNFGYLVSVPEALDSPWKRFVAPEVAGGGELTPRADIYALGAVFYELLTGQLHGPDALPPQLVSGGGEKVYEVWKKATAQDPAARYATVQEFKAACLAALPKPRAAAAKVAVTTPVAGARSHPTPAGHAPAKPATIHKVGFNWKLLRNLIIIAILLYLINLAWHRYQNEKADRARIAAEHIEEKERREAELRAKQAAQLAESRRKWEEMQAQSQKVDEPAPLPPVEPPAPEPTPFESLERLKEKLVAGDRSEMPPDAKAIGQGHYMLIDKPMTWPDAAWFAEKHGAHLVIPSSEATLDALRGTVMSGASQEIWIGAAKNGLDTWGLADGTPWKPATKPQGDGCYVSVTSSSLLRSNGPNVAHPFIIEWHNDGKNPGSLRQLAELTRESIANSSPVYPPGTRAFGVRNYLYVSRPITWENALKIAKAAGGHLMVSRGIAENFNLERMTADIKAEDGIWIGGLGKDQQWAWVTGEGWDKAKWVDDAVPAAEGKVLLIQPDRGWVARDRTQLASGFIIEWSTDAALSAGR